MRYGLFLFKMLVSFVLVWFVYRQVEGSEQLWQALQMARWQWVCLAALLLPVNIFLAGWKWYRLLRSRESDILPGQAFASLMMGFTLGAITPGRLGELGRGLYFLSRNPLAVTGLNLLDKFMNQLIFFTFGLFSLFYLLNQNVRLAPWAFLPLAVLSTLLILLLWVLVLSPDWTRSFLFQFVFLLKRRKVALQLLSGLKNLHRREIAHLIGLTILWYGVIVVQYHFLVLAFAPVQFWQTFQAVSATIFVKSLVPLTYGDLGIREGLVVYFYHFFQIPSGAVFNASLLIFFLNFVLPALSGLPFVFWVRNGRKELVAMREAAMESAALGEEIEHY